MEVTEKKIKANQENSKLGGVKTDEGKAVSRMNALKHGILANCMTKYDQVQVADIYQELAKEFDASTFSRRMLIEQLSLAYVRLGRCARLETELIRQSLNPPKYESPYENIGYTSVLIAANDKATLTAEHFEQLEIIYLRYEPWLLTHIMRLLALLKH